MRRFFLGLAIGFATIAPTWAQANDEQIAQEIIDKLQTKKQAGQLRGFNIDLEVSDGTVWLSGTVASAEQQKLALDVARRASGVEQVVNDLKVESSDEQPAERTVAPTPASASKTNGPKPALLNGLLAKPLAGGAPAEANDAAPADDELVQRCIRQLSSLKQSGQLRGFRVDIQAENGVVWVSGDVADDRQHSLVIETVRRVAGVKQVVNDLKVGAVRPSSGPTPAVPRVDAEGTGVTSMPRNLRMVNHESGGQPQAAPAPSAPYGYTAVPVRVLSAPAPFAPPGAAVAPLAQAGRAPNQPLAFAPAAGAAPRVAMMQGVPPQASAPEMPMPSHVGGPNVGVAPARYDHPNLPGYAWPSYAAYPNYAAVTYPKQYSPAAWPYIGPFYPYPQVPLGWRKVSLEWDDGWWMLDFKSK